MTTFTNSDGASMHVKVDGDDNDGPVVVFLNGMTQTTRHWASHVRALRDSRRILTYDSRGQGQSDPPKSTPTLALHTSDLREILDHLGIDKVDLVGFSHGARIALGFATSYPDRVRRLVLCSATAEPTALARTIIRSWQKVLETGGLSALAWCSLPTILGPKFLEQNERLLTNVVKASVERNSEMGTRLLLDGLAEFPPLDDLAGKVRAKTLVLSATEDPLVSPEGARKLAKLCGGSHKLVEDSGHTIPIERPKYFRELVTNFLAR